MVHMAERNKFRFALLRCFLSAFDNFFKRRGLVPPRRHRTTDFVGKICLHFRIDTGGTKWGLKVLRNRPFEGITRQFHRYWTFGLPDKLGLPL